ncbi:MAG: carbohydrate ABC transporter permease [Clostridiales bacterium]|nr:carbohydrate ABC transporter permease [Clostridiales bacterium]
MQATESRRTAIGRRFRPQGLIVYLLLIGITLISAIPLYWLIRSSLMTNAEIFIFPPRFVPNTFRWDNYVKAYRSFPALMYLGNTLSIVVPCVIGVTLTSAMCGYALARIDFPGRKIWFTLVIGSMILPGHVVLIPQYITFAKAGMINTYWPFWLAAWMGGGASNIFLMRQFMRTLPKEYDEAAIIDGANRFQIFVKILLPLIVPVLITVSIFSFMGYWNDFQGPLIYLQRDSRFTLALGLLSFRGAYSSKWNYLMAASTAMIMPAIILFAVGQKYFLRGITLTGLKG